MKHALLAKTRLYIYLSNVINETLRHEIAARTPACSQQKNFVTVYRPVRRVNKSSSVDFNLIPFTRTLHECTYAVSTIGVQP